jgi:hypothetical protein
MSAMTENAKTRKHIGELGYTGAILYLAPARTSTVTNVCPYASPGCGGADGLGGACLNMAGHGALPSTQAARVGKTVLWASDRPRFFTLLIGDLARVEEHAAADDHAPIARLNGTSDIAFERYPVERDGHTYPHIFAAFPRVQFYDYTKDPHRLGQCRAIPNYQLTFSLSESNDQHALAALAAGFNVAAVISGDVRETWSGYPTIDGDAHDFRFMDPAGPGIVVLTPKGPARRDTSGFVRGAADRLDISRTPTFARKSA